MKQRLAPKVCLKLSGMMENSRNVQDVKRENKIHKRKGRHIISEMVLIAHYQYPLYLLGHIVQTQGQK